MIGVTVAMEPEEDYTPLNRKSPNIFIYIPRYSSAIQSFMNERVLKQLKESTQFNNIRITTSQDFVVGTDRQDSFITCHNASTCAIYPICSEFLDEFKSSFTNNENKVIFLICEEGTEIPQQWRSLEMLNYLINPEDTYLLNRLIKSVRSILEKRYLSELPLQSDVETNAEKRKAIEYVLLHSDRGNSYISKEFQPSFDPDTLPGLKSCLEKLNVDNGDSKKKPRNIVLQVHLKPAIKNKDIEALGLCLTCKDEKVFSAALHKCIELLFTTRLNNRYVSCALSTIASRISTAIQNNNVHPEYRATLLTLAIINTIRLLLFMCTNEHDVTDDYKQMTTLVNNIKTSNKWKKGFCVDSNTQDLFDIFVQLWGKVGKLETGSESKLAQDLAEFNDDSSKDAQYSFTRTSNKPTRFLPLILKTTCSILDETDKDGGFHMLKSLIGHIKQNQLGKQHRTVAAIFISYSLRYSLENCFGWPECYGSLLLDRASEFMRCMRQQSSLTHDVIAILQQCIFCSHLKRYRAFLLNSFYGTDVEKLMMAEEGLFRAWMVKEYMCTPFAIHDGFIQSGVISVFQAAIDQTKVDGKIATGMLKPVKLGELDSLHSISVAINALQKLSEDKNIIEILAYQKSSSKPMYYMTPRSEQADLFTFLQNVRIHDEERIDLFTMVGFALDICSAVQACLNQDIMPLQLLLENFGVHSVNGKLVLKLKDFEQSVTIEQEDGPSFSCATAHTLIPVRYLAPECLLDDIFNKRSLVYYVGCVIYSLFLYGAPPFFEQSMKTKMELAHLKITCRYHLKQTANIGNEIYAIIESATLGTASNRCDLHTLRALLAFYQQSCPDQVDLQEHAPDLPIMNKFSGAPYHLSAPEVGINKEELYRLLDGDSAYFANEDKNIYDVIEQRDPKNGIKRRSTRDKRQSVYDKNAMRPEFYQFVPSDSNSLKDLRDLCAIWMKEFPECAAHVAERPNGDLTQLTFSCDDTTPLLSAVGHLNSEEVIQIMVKITRGLHTDFHRHGYLHNDLRAANILVNKTTQDIVFTKFGHVRKLPKRRWAKGSSAIEQQCLKISDKDIHEDTFRWCAYEVLRLKERRIKSEIYALGVIFWQIWEARNQAKYQVNPTAIPYRGIINLTHAMLADNLEKQRDLLLQPEDCPTCIFKLMKKCWKLDPIFRPSWKDIVTALESGHLEDISPRMDDADRPIATAAATDPNGMCNSIIKELKDHEERQDIEHGYYEQGPKKIKLRGSYGYNSIANVPPPPDIDMSPYVNMENGVYVDASSKWLYVNHKKINSTDYSDINMATYVNAYDAQSESSSNTDIYASLSRYGATGCDHENRLEESDHEDDYWMPPVTNSEVEEKKGTKPKKKPKWKLGFSRKQKRSHGSNKILLNNGTDSQSMDTSESC